MTDELDEARLERIRQKMREEGLEPSNPPTFPTKQENIRNFNTSPIVREYGVKAVDTKYIKLLWGIIIAFILIGGVFVYLVNDGKLKAVTNLMCSNVTCEGAICGSYNITIPPAPPCTNICNLTFSPKINCNSTG